MEKTTKVMESSELYRKIDALPMSERERLKVTGAVKAADRLLDAYYEGAVFLARAGSWFAPSPKLKHQ